MVYLYKVYGEEYDYVLDSFLSVPFNVDKFYCFESDKTDLREIVQDIARNFYEKDEVTDKDWPLSFSIYDENKELLISTEVKIEYEINFYPNF